jgi:hypothetical protein
MRASLNVTRTRLFSSVRPYFPSLPFLAPTHSFTSNMGPMPYIRLRRLHIRETNPRSTSQSRHSSHQLPPFPIQHRKPLISHFKVLARSNPDSIATATEKRRLLVHASFVHVRALGMCYHRPLPVPFYQHPYITSCEVHANPISLHRNGRVNTAGARFRLWRVMCVSFISSAPVFTETVTNQRPGVG